MLPRFISIAVGIWLMAAPAFLAYSGIAEKNDRIIGPLIVSFAIISIAQVTRQLRLVNMVLGLWLIIAPFLLGYEEPVTVINNMASGIVVIFMASVKGKITHSYGGGWLMLFKKSNNSRSTGTL